MLDNLTVWDRIIKTVISPHLPAGTRGIISEMGMVSLSLCLK